MTNAFRVRYYFRHGDVHDADERMSRYVTRLSIALGDLRVAATYATRKRQNSAERLYFVRLTASHLREAVLIMDPSDHRVVPSLEEFLAALPRGTKPSRTEIRRSHARALRMLAREMPSGRPVVASSSGTLRRPTLRDDLRELRNRFFHYGHDAPGDEALRVAMGSLDGETAGYIIREHTLRAHYADDVGFALAHPFPKEFATTMHARIVDLIGPVSLFIHQVEAAWLHAHRDQVEVRFAGHERQTLREWLDGLT